jgi:hypothetical protein
VETSVVPAELETTIEFGANVVWFVPPFETARVPARVTVPDVVTGPPLNVSPVVPPDASMDVTVPEIHVPFFAKHPPLKSIPLANVDVAEVPVIFKYVAETPAPNVDVALPVMVLVAVPLPAYTLPRAEMPVVLASVILNSDGMDKVTAPVEPDAVI